MCYKSNIKTTWFTWPSHVCQSVKCTWVHMVKDHAPHQHMVLQNVPRGLKEEPLGCHKQCLNKHGCPVRTEKNIYLIRHPPTYTAVAEHVLSFIFNSRWDFNWKHLHKLFSMADSAYTGVICFPYRQSLPLRTIPSLLLTIFYNNFRKAGQLAALIIYLLFVHRIRKK